MKTGLEESLDLITQEIIDSNVLLDDLCPLIAEYTITRLRIDKFRNEVDESNYIYVSRKDYDFDSLMYLKTSHFIYIVKCHLTVEKGKIVLSEDQRKFIGASLNDPIYVIFSTSGFRVKNFIILKILFTHTKLSSGIKYDINSFIEVFKDKYKNHIFTVNQIFSIKLDGVDCRCRILRSFQNKKHKYELTGDFNGKLTNETEIYLCGPLK